MYVPRIFPAKTNDNARAQSDESIPKSAPNFVMNIMGTLVTHENGSDPIK